MASNVSPFWSVPAADLFGRMRTTPAGLAPEEAAERLARYGANVLKPRRVERQGARFDCGSIRPRTYAPSSI